MNAAISRRLYKEVLMNPNDNEAIEELGIASVETLGDEFPVPEQIGHDLKLGGGISAD